MVLIVPELLIVLVPPVAEMPKSAGPVVLMLPNSVTLKLSLPSSVWVVVTSAFNTTTVANAGRAGAAIRPKTVGQRTKRGQN